MPTAGKYSAALRGLAKQRLKQVCGKENGRNFTGMSSTPCRKGHMPITLVLIFLASLTAASAQDSTVTRVVFAHTSLFYDFPQSYGLAGGIACPFRSMIKTRKSKLKDRLWILDAGVYRYPFNYTGILFMPGYGVRHYVSKNFSYTPAVNIGVLRTFYDGRVYEVDAVGNVKEKPLYGRFYATTHVSVAFDHATKKAINVELKPSIWFQYPYDSFIKPHISLEAGVQYAIGKHQVKMKSHR